LANNRKTINVRIGPFAFDVQISKRFRGSSGRPLAIHKANMMVLDGGSSGLRILSNGVSADTVSWPECVVKLPISLMADKPDPHELTISLDSRAGLLCFSLYRPNATMRLAGN
jgi:hypothetical protein